MKKYEKLSSCIMIAVFILFIFGFAIAGLVSRDRDFSEMENRNLARFPEFSFDALKSGSFTGDIESYMSDQVFLKDSLVSLKTDCERAVLKTCQNGVYFGKDGYYLQQYTENLSQIDKNINCINDWTENIESNIPINFILVPNAVSILEDKLPLLSVNDNQLDSIAHIEDTLSDRITLFNAYDALKAEADKNVQVFYKTDHHWTNAGAKAVFEAFLSSEREPVTDDEFDSTIKRDDFYGTLYSKAPSAFTEPDTMILPEHSDMQLTVEYVNENKTTDSIIDKSFLDKKDKYSAFLGGNFARVNIKSKDSITGQKVLILKDSYANAMMPYFADQYPDITILDMRYYHFEDRTVSELVNSGDFDRIILLYNMDFINSDDNFIWLE